MFWIVFMKDTDFSMLQFRQADQGGAMNVQRFPPQELADMSLQMMPTKVLVEIPK